MYSEGWYPSRFENREIGCYLCRSCKMQKQITGPCICFNSIHESCLIDYIREHSDQIQSVGQNRFIFPCKKCDVEILYRGNFKIDWTEKSHKDYYVLIGLLILLGVLIASAFGVIYASFFYTWLLWVLLFLLPIIVLLGSCIFNVSTIRFFYRKGRSRFNPKLLIQIAHEKEGDIILQPIQ